MSGLIRNMDLATDGVGKALFTHCISPDTFPGLQRKANEKDCSRRSGDFINLALGRHKTDCSRGIVLTSKIYHV